MNKLQLKKQDPELYNEILKWPGKKFNEQQYNYHHHITEIPKCPICGKEVTFQSSNDGYRKYCSNKCAGADKEVKEKRKKTCLEKYGVEFAAQSEQTLEAYKKTCLERYGTEHFSNREKFKATMMKRYGYVGLKCTPEVIAKLKKTYLQRYGDEYPMKMKSINAKRKQTCLQKYGTEHPMNLDATREKLSAAKRTTFLLGDQSGTKLYENVLGYTENGDWICKCPHPECNECQEKRYIINSRMASGRMKDGTEPCTRLLPIQQTKFSTLELKIRNQLTEIGIEYTTNDRRFGQEMDIYIPSLKLAIEVNGCYWHSTQHKTSSYHINKSLLLSDHGIRCVFVWDDYKDEDIHEFLHAIIKDMDLSPWIKKWFPDIDGWPADFGLIDGQWQEHRCIHGEYECYDAGVFV